MNLDPPLPPFTTPASLPGTRLLPTVPADDSNAAPTPLAGPSRVRTLRARPSDPSPTSPSSSNMHVRQLSRREMENIQRRLGPEGIAAKKEDLLRSKEAELQNVIHGHDTAIREKFHLERFVTILTGWDPEVSYCYRFDCQLQLIALRRMRRRTIRRSLSRYAVSRLP